MYRNGHTHLCSHFSLRQKSTFNFFLEYPTHAMHLKWDEDSLNVTDWQELSKCIRIKVKKKKFKKERTFNLFSQAVIRIRRHACRHVKDGFHSGGSIVRSCETCAAIPLESTHEATVCSEVHLMGEHADVPFIVTLWWLYICVCIEATSTRI